MPQKHGPGGGCCACSICAYWPFDDYPLFPTGPAADVSGSGFHLTEGASIPASASGLIGLNRTFDGVYDRLEHDSTSCFSLGLGHTVWGWVKYALTDSSSPGHIIAGKALNFSVDREWFIVVDVSPTPYNHEGQVFGSVLDVNNLTYSTPSIHLGAAGENVQNNWWFVALWADPLTLEVGIRVNNNTQTIVTSDTTGTAFQTTNDGFAIGGWHTTQSYLTWKPMKGEVDEWGFANCVLTSDQLDDLYNGGAGVNFPTAQTIVEV